ncbi:CDGSH iron-sulfur domain-containing protein [Magnetococcales bacterium HHB-1]
MSQTSMFKRNEPYKVPCQAGESILVCQCGLTDDAPYCTGKHKEKQSGKGPVKLSATEARTFYICGCNQSGTMPECDGAHKTCPENETFMNRW